MEPNITSYTCGNDVCGSLSTRHVSRFQPRFQTLRYTTTCAGRLSFTQPITSLQLWHFGGSDVLPAPQILSQRSTGTLTLSRAAVKTPHRGVWGVRRCGRRELCVVEAHILWYLTDGCEATGQCTWTHCKDIHYLKPDSQLEQLKGVFGCHGRIYKWVISIFGFGCKRGKKG